MATGSRLQRLVSTVSDVVQSKEFEQFRVDARDFLSAREQSVSIATEISQMTVSMDEVPEVINRSFPRHTDDGQYTNVISPVVVPKSSRSLLWIWVAFFFFLMGLMGGGTLMLVSAIPGTGNLAVIFFGPHYWIILISYVIFQVWRNSYAMIPDGCQALITKFGKLETVVGAGRVSLLDPWKKVSYIVNTTKEYPYNAPIREAPTSERVNASVDLFLQFRVEDPVEFIFTLGGAHGFSEKLENAISEVTRALIYEQKADRIYDLVGESTQSLLESLNRQFLPAVRFVNANITHAEPSSQQYRMDLAAPEMVRVAKEAYTYEYELQLRKEQDEGDFERELASLQETLSEIRAEIARYQAQIDTAREKEFNRANAYARQLMSEAESSAKANSALLEAQALDIRAISAAYFPEILDYRYQQDMLNRLEAVADRLPQIVNVGTMKDQTIDFSAIARTMLGLHGESLYTEQDIQLIREHIQEIKIRIKERAEQIARITAAERAQLGELSADSATVVAAAPAAPVAPVAAAAPAPVAAQSSVLPPTPAAPPPSNPDTSDPSDPSVLDMLLHEEE